MALDNPPQSTDVDAYIEDQVIPSDVDASLKTISTNSPPILITNFHSFLLGSTDGVTYGTESSFYIPVNTAGMKEISIGLYTGASAFNVDVTLTIWATDGKVTFSPLAYSKIGEIILPSATSIYTVIGTAAAGDGITSPSPAVNNAYYSIPVIKNVAGLRLKFNASSAPTSGAFGKIAVWRMP